MTDRYNPFGLPYLDRPVDTPNYAVDSRWPDQPSVADAHRMGGLAGTDQYAPTTYAPFDAYDRAQQAQHRDEKQLQRSQRSADVARALAGQGEGPADIRSPITGMNPVEQQRMADALGNALAPDNVFDAATYFNPVKRLGAIGRAVPAAAGAVLGSDTAEARSKPGAIGAAVRKAMPKATAENWLPVSPTRFVGDEAQRVFSPGIYRDPRIIAAEANARVAPEHPAMKQLFGVTRDDLYEISKQGTREGNITDPGLWAPGKTGAGNYAANAIMNPANAQRLIDNLTEAKNFPALAKGMIPWYVMDPAFQRMVQLVGKDRAVAEYTRFNSMMTPFSASSDVMKEINRGTAARMMADRGEWDKFVKYGGMPVERRGADFPPEMAGVIPHLRHESTHTPAAGRYLATGAHGYGDDTVKIPLYTQASGVPETGFQTRFPVPDAHFTRASGMSDVRKNAGPGDFMGGSEWRTFSPWFRESVAKPVGIEAVPAQALMWGAFSPQTGVKTPIGAPKLELISQRIWERAHELGIDPKKLRDMVLTGKGHAALPFAAGAPLGAGMMGGTADQSSYNY